MLTEIIVLITAFTLMFVDLFLKRETRYFLMSIPLGGLALAFISVFFLSNRKSFGGQFSLENIDLWLKVFFILCAFVIVIASFSFILGESKETCHKKQIYSFEFLTILLFNLSGMLFLVSARDLLTLYVSLELSTLPLFILTAWKRDALSSEAGLKYVVLGALASALLLLGFSIFYGLTGTMDLVLIGRSINVSPLFWFASALVISAIGFKLTLVPFHMWAPDVYQGAPTVVTAYLSVASKGAGLVLMFQIFFRIFDISSFYFAIALLSALTMTLGNVVAIVQENIKRFMCFSAISQAGYLIMGFLGGFNANSQAVPSLVFYLFAYGITNLVVFLVVIWFIDQTGKENIKDFQGLSRTHPLIALSMMIGLFGLAGIPPLSGFIGKFFLFSVAASSGFYWLVAVAAINSVISLYYYLRIVRQMYIEPVLETTTFSMNLSTRCVLGSLVIASVLLGLVPVFYETILWTWKN
ncbi:MAG: NADH-quinone oxidoreductase subunit N [Bdellovibrio sp.]|nr:NADH-quinone oxidoreductase subunit N [Bdellovibrio sp.]